MFSAYRAVLLVVAMAWFGYAAAADRLPPNGTFQHVIEHEKYGRIGTHTVSFRRQGEDLIVDVRLRIDVRVLLWDYQVKADRREVWRAGRLVAYDSVTDEDGEITRVTARADGDRLVIQGSDGRIVAPGTVFPTHPWNPEIVRHTLLMHTKTGELKRVRVSSAGEEFVRVGGKSVKTWKYLMSGELRRELWYDENGVCVQVRLRKQGDDVTLTLREAPALASAPYTLPALP